MINKIKFAALSTLMFLAASVNAQPGFDDDVVDTPIDGGVWVLVAVVAIYGIRVIQKRRAVSN